MTKKVTKPSPPAAEDTAETRNEIKIAARRLFAEHGVEAVTVRQIVAAAGAKNGGSLNYYFKTKEGLIEELLIELFRDVSDSAIAALAKLEKAGGATCIRDVVEILVHSAHFERSSDSSPTAYRFLASVLFTRRRMVSEFLTKMNFSIFNYLLRYIEDLRGDIPIEVMRQRIIFLAWYNVSILAAHEAYSESKKSSPIWTGFDAMQNLIDTAVGLLEAPVTLPAAPTTVKPRSRGAVTPSQPAKRGRPKAKS